MEITGRVWKSRKDKFWLAEIPFLNLMVQSTTKKGIPAMIKDAVELLVNETTFSVDVTLSGNDVYLEANDLKRLISLILKRLRSKNNLKLEEVAARLKEKSVNSYAQYEQAKHLPSLEKFDELLKAVNPSANTILTWR